MSFWDGRQVLVSSGRRHWDSNYFVVFVSCNHDTLQVYRQHYDMSLPMLTMMKPIFDTDLRDHVTLSMVVNL